jgi:putative drug exporter of the RND superfamily
VRVGVIRTVGTTGGVITSAGLIFAASMFGLMTASIYTMAEAGFILGMGILIDTFIVRTITVPALAAMIGQGNWWPSHLGKSPHQVYLSHQWKRQQRDHLTGRLVRMKVLPERSHTLPPHPPSSGDSLAKTGERPATFDDLLVRLKLVPPRNTHTPVSRAASDSLPIANGKRPVARRFAHSLPLFDLSGASDPLTDEPRDSARKSSTTNGNGKRNGDPGLGHSLPLFGHDILSSQPVLVGANGNGHSNGNGNGHSEQPVDDDLSSPLPLFGGAVLSTQASNGNGEHR